jgi:hypothetical protein
VCFVGSSSIKVRFGAAAETNRLAAYAPQNYFPEATSFWNRGSLPATASKLRLRLGNLDKFTAVGLLASGTAGLYVTVQTLDPAGATQE